MIKSPRYYVTPADEDHRWGYTQHEIAVIDTAFAKVMASDTPSAKRFIDDAQAKMQTALDLWGGGSEKSRALDEEIAKTSKQITFDNMFDKARTGK